ncbi:MAG: septum formation initiator family protein [Pseudolysinimonas sp.]|uniref:FtsB family cell division protein n=1 Tax=Pseudolysinimonas sp. TaxID=2680009 RepID=UPI0032675FDB
MARKQRQIPVAMAPESRAAAWLRNFRMSGFALSLLLLVVCALVVLAPNLKTFVEQQQQIAQLEKSLTDAQTSVDELNGEIARWSDPAYIESQARDRLYYVYPGDITFLVIGDDPATGSPDGLPVSGSIQTGTVDWVHALLDTVYRAGLTDATPDQLDGGQVGSPTQGG